MALSSIKVCNISLRSASRLFFGIHGLISATRRWNHGHVGLAAMSGLTCAAALLSAAGMPAAEAREQKQTAGHTGAKATPRHNIVFILLDDLRFDMLGFLQPGIKTPNIDMLAHKGAHFSQAVVTSSLCSPSRATILTGLNTRNHRVVENGESSEAGLRFFPSYLRDAGYQTAFIGKWHMGSTNDGPRPGFDKWISFRGQGTYFPTDGLSPERVARGDRQMLNVDGRSVARKGYLTDELTDYAMNWLERERDPSKPFFLYLSHKAVHTVPQPPERYRQQYVGLDVRLPSSETGPDAPMWVKNARNSINGVEFPQGSSQSMQEIARDIYRTLSPVDDSLGRIMRYLKRARLDKNTMVVFYSDNGYLIGEHGLINKRNAYQPSIRVPLLVYAPGIVPEGQVIDARVRNLDIAPTFLELAGLEKPSQMEGKSFLSLAKGTMSTAEWTGSDDFIYEYYWEAGQPYVPTTFAIIRGNMKYIQYYGVWDIEELFDLEKDPEEARNLIADPAYANVKATLRKDLYHQLADRNGQRVIPFGRRFVDSVDLRNEQGSRAADFPSSWYAAPTKELRSGIDFARERARARSLDGGRPASGEAPR
jgi:arylsulfatase A-like enzyme